MFPFLWNCLVLLSVCNLHAQIKNSHIKREFSACSFNQLIADTERGYINKKLETIEIYDFNGNRTFYWIDESTVIGCYMIEPGLDAVVKQKKMYQYLADSLMIDAFLNRGKTKESMSEFDKSCLDCSSVSHVVYKIRRRRCPKVISSTLVINSY